MPVAYESDGGGVFCVANNNNAITVPLPAIRPVGSVFLLAAFCRLITAAAPTIAGYTLLGTWTSATASGGRMWLYGRIVDGTETAPSVTPVGATGTTGDIFGAGIVCYSGVDTSSGITAIFDGTPTTTDASGTTTCTYPALTITQSNSMIMRMLTRFRDAVDTFTPTATWNERADLGTTTRTGGQFHMQDKAATASGAQASVTVAPSNTTAARYLAVTLALKARPAQTYFGAVSQAITFAATTAGQASTPGPFEDPSDLSGLAVWYKADVLSLTDGTDVASWPDSSAAGRTLTSVAPGLPTFQTNELNGLPGVLFDGIDDYLTYQAGAAWITGKEVTVFAVFRQIAGISNGRLMAFNTQEADDYGTPSWTIYDGGAADRIAPYSNGELAIQVPHPVGATLMTTWFGADDTHNLRVDRAPASTPSVSTAQMQPFSAFGTLRITLGSGWFGTPSSGGNKIFHEVVVYNRELTSVERGQVEDYLYDKWLTAAAPTTHYGATSLTTNFSATIAGRRKTFGQVAQSLTFSAVVAGSRKAFGQLAMPLTFSKSVSGIRKTFGQLLSPFIFGKSVAGSKTTFGQTALAITATIVTAGYRAGLTLYGALSLPITFGKDVRGQRKAFGQIAMPLTFTKDVRGQRKTFGQITFPIIFTKEAVGRKNVFGQLSMQTLFGKETTGRRRTFSQLAMPMIFSKAVSGRRKTFGRVALPINATIVVNGIAFTGPKTYYGQLSLPLKWTVVDIQHPTAGVAGIRKTFGKTNSPFIFGAASQGKRRTFGKFDLPLEFEAMVKSGRITTHGALDLDLLLMMNTSGYIMVKTALNDAIDVYLGDQEALAVYIGSERVWP